MNIKDKNKQDTLMNITKFFNMFFKVNKQRLFPKDKDNIIYLPLFYIELLRDIIIKRYEKSNDPIVTGYISKGNLDYIIDYVGTIYNEIEDKREKLIYKSAFMLYNIALKHPFTDGNKRTAIISCNSFLEYNGYSIGSLPFEESLEFIKSVAMGDKTEEECREFIRKNIRVFEISDKTIERLKEFDKKLNESKEI